MLIDTNQFIVDRLSKDQSLPADRTAVIIIDMLNQFCDPQWWADDDMQFNLSEPYGSNERVAYFTKELARIIPNIKTTLDAFRSAGALVVHVTMGKWTTDGREMVNYMRGRDYESFGSEPMSIIEPLKMRPGEILVRKSTSSAFTGTGLDFLLRNANIEHIVLCGQFGNGCVLYTMIQSREYGYHNYWVEDAILYQGQPFQEVMPPLIGSRWAKLTTADQVTRALEQ